LLSHLNHHNASIKLDALTSIKEMLLSNNDLIRTELGNFLEHFCPLFTDREYKVRDNAINIFNTFLNLPYFIPSGNNNNSLRRSSLLSPFFGLINVHLSCAMTHIVENVQYTSLKVLDILIENLPELVKIHAYNIFENFIDQISKASLRGDKRVLKNDPYKMTSTQAWRHNVLSRLHKMLLIVSSKVTIDSSKLDQQAEDEFVVEFNDIRQCLITKTTLNDQNCKTLRLKYFKKFIKFEKKIQKIETNFKVKK
jgi:pre-rRNA-processing protein IPI1